ncbi:MAG TPA: CDP-6-deoxy-delta-3,4-glucoseen reductase [Leucothrix mucor]|uniref:CDP-6-deoxy-delta-3,4-glucoseen reductase n=1 Tax=Leucothrix mucor TaxID=45248 RepID=A0A7V2T3I8_LEUMU|nr:CDP-6-deoxy-delta-3,4-glucoseen reductase [Leucothrix mucor]
MSFDVKISPSGHQFTVKENELILDAALRQGISFPYGCRSGACGNCLGKVVSGEVSYPEGLPVSLSEDDHQKGQALFCSAVANSSLEIEVAEIPDDEIAVQTLPTRVTSLQKLCHDVMEMKLTLPEGKRLAFHAGQYIEFLLRDNKKRSFSLANSPTNDTTLELHIRLVEGGKFTTHVFEEMKEKALVRIHGPLGTFFVRDTDRPLIFIAGGTGFAPLKGMLEQLITEETKREVHFYWGVRGKQDLYSDRVEAWAKDSDYIHYIPVLSAADDGDQWQGRTGFVHQAVAEDFSDLSAYDVYMAGPPPMINAAKALFSKQGLPDAQLFSDSFDFSHDNK